MPELRLDELGNFPEHYHPISQYVKFEDYVHNGRVTDPRLVLKVYSLFPVQPFPEKRVKHVMRLLTNHIYLCRIESFSGLGFAIHSEDTLNVARWDLNTPHLLKSSLYELSGNREEPNMRLLDIDTEGAFCAWELFIVQNERDAWLRFLNSPRDRMDKNEYLKNILQGRLRPDL